MRFEELDDDEDRDEDIKNRPVKRMVFSIEQVSNGFIVEVKGSIYVFKTLAESFEFFSAQMSKNYEASNVR